MKKKLIGGLLTAAVALSMNVTVFAAGWVQNSTGWWYDYGNGTWPASSWQWIDGNNDGIAECYYFDQYGYCLMNTTTPDGYQVDGNGAWIVNGAIQTRSTAGTSADTSGSSQQDSSAPGTSALDLTPVSTRAYNKFQNEKNNRGQLWGEGFTLDPYPTSGWVEYCVNEQYSKLEFTVAPQEGFTDYGEVYFEVYGDDDEQLYSSDDLDYRSEPEEVSVDITGQDYVKIYATTSDEWGLLVGFPKTELMFKNVEFK